MASKPTGNPVGKPSTYDPEYHPQKMVELTREQGLSHYEIAITHFDVNTSTLSDWAKRYPEFANAMRTCKDYHANKYLKLAAVNAEEDVGNQGMIKFLLSNYAPKDFQDQTKVTQTNVNIDPSAEDAEKILNDIGF